MLKQVIVDYINAVVEEFFESPDASQLTLSIWAGEITVSNLILRPAAIEKNLNVPLTIVCGKVEDVKVKIPWTSMFVSPIEVSVSGVDLLVTPSYSTYDSAMQEQIAASIKKSYVKKLEHQFEEVILKRDCPSRATSGVQNPIEPSGYVSQILQNMRFSFHRIHLRYEDDETFENRPFALGLICNKVLIYTILRDTQTMAETFVGISSALKVVSLDGLAVYWDFDPELVSNKRNESLDTVTENLQALFAKENLEHVPYVLPPTNLEVHFSSVSTLAEPGENDTPKTSFTFEITGDIQLELNPRCYICLLEMKTKLAAVANKIKYRGLKTEYFGLPLSHHSRYVAWWRFAYECILRDVKHERSFWRLNDIIHHRELCRKYSDLYLKKLSNTTVELTENEGLDDEITELEAGLDAFNIFLVRAQVRLRLKRLESLQSSRSSTWYSMWTRSTTSLATNEIESTYTSPFSVEEKFLLIQLLCRCNVLNSRGEVTSPKVKDVRLFLDFQFGKFSLLLKDGADAIMTINIDGSLGSVVLEPKNGSAKADYQCSFITVYGIDNRPYLGITKLFEQPPSPIECHFEMEKVEEPKHHKIGLSASFHPLQIIYHWETLQRLLDSFSNQNPDGFGQYSETTHATGGKDPVLTQFDIDVNIAEPYFLVPQFGDLTRNAAVFVLDVDLISFKSQLGKTGENAYIVLKIEDVRGYVAKSDDKYGYKTVKTLSEIYYQKMATVKNILFGNGENLPIDIHAELSPITVEISPQKIVDLLDILIDLPLPAKTRARKGGKIEFDKIPDSKRRSLGAFLNEDAPKSEPTFVMPNSSFVLKHKLTIDSISVRLYDDSSENQRALGICLTDILAQHTYNYSPTSDAADETVLSIKGMQSCLQHGNAETSLVTVVESAPECPDEKEEHYFLTLQVTRPAGTEDQNVKASVATILVDLSPSSIKTMVFLLQGVLVLDEKRRKLKTETTLLSKCLHPAHDLQIRVFFNAVILHLIVDQSSTPFLELSFRYCNFGLRRFCNFAIYLVNLDRLEAFKAVKSSKVKVFGSGRDKFMEVKAESVRRRIDRSNIQRHVLKMHVQPWRFICATPLQRQLLSFIEELTANDLDSVHEVATLSRRAKRSNDKQEYEVKVQLRGGRITLKKKLTSVNGLLLNFEKFALRKLLPRIPVAVSVGEDTVHLLLENFHIFRTRTKPKSNCKKVQLIILHPVSITGSLSSKQASSESNRVTLMDFNFGGLNVQLDPADIALFKSIFASIHGFSATIKRNEKLDGTSTEKHVKRMEVEKTTSETMRLVVTTAGAHITLYSLPTIMKSDLPNGIATRQSENNLALLSLENISGNCNIGDNGRSIRIMLVVEKLFLRDTRTPPYEGKHAATILQVTQESKYEGQPFQVSYSKSPQDGESSELNTVSLRVNEAGIK